MIEKHERFMRRAIALARRAREGTWPNPMVGAVVVRAGRLVGEGYHRRAGEPHAEVHALRAAGHRARGADLYVTLEPCHRYGRTPPCTELIARSGIRRVLVGTRDPNPKERGRGLSELRRLGIQVTEGVLERECRELNRVYNVFIAKKRPFVAAKAAVSLDGRLATATGDSRWLSGKTARVYAHRLRAHAQAVMVGAATARLDDPALDVRHVRGKDPAVAIIDPRLTLRPAARIFKVKSERKILLYCTRRAPRSRRRALEAAGAGVIAAPVRGGRLDLCWILKDLFRRGVYRLLVEGGGRLFGFLLEERLIDWLEIILCGRLLGSDGVPLVGTPGPRTLRQAPYAEPLSVRRLGENLLLSGPLVYP